MSSRANPSADGLALAAEVGTRDAPKGTAPWARAMRAEFRPLWHDGPHLHLW
jgi:hypothetical protein